MKCSYSCSGSPSTLQLETFPELSRTECVYHNASHNKMWCLTAAIMWSVFCWQGPETTRWRHNNKGNINGSCVCGTNHNFAISKSNTRFQCAQKEEIGPRGCFHLIFTSISSLITNGQRIQRENIQIWSLTFLQECQRQCCWLDCSLDVTGRHCTPSCNHRFGCFILEEPDNLFNLTSLEVPAYDTNPGSSKDTNKTEN